MNKAQWLTWSLSAAAAIESFYRFRKRIGLQHDCFAFTPQATLGQTVSVART